jgi:hypothetical protein
MIKEDGVQTNDEGQVCKARLNLIVVEFDVKEDNDNDICKGRSALTLGDLQRRSK